MSTFRGESEQHVVHRLEAFSDVVIGFSLAQMTLNLVLPGDVLTLFSEQYQSLVAFALTFIIVAGMWWSFHRLYTQYFVPTRLNIVLNFLGLGGVMFLVYTLQVWLHAHAHKNVAYGMYAGSIAWVQAILAVLTYRGITLRAGKLDPATLLGGRRRATGLTITAAAFTVIAIASLLAPKNPNFNWLLLAVAALFIVVRLVQSRADRTENVKAVSDG